MCLIASSQLKQMDLNCKSMLQKLEHYCTPLENEMHTRETFFIRGYSRKVISSKCLWLI